MRIQLRIVRLTHGSLNVFIVLQEVELLMRGVSVDEGAETDAVVSIEEVEKTGREQLERSLQTVTIAGCVQHVIY